MTEQPSCDGTTRGLWISLALPGNVARRCGKAGMQLSQRYFPGRSAVPVSVSVDCGFFQPWHMEDSPPERIFMFMA